jgi:DNA-binding Lrp family transcriptional regulator
MYNFDKIDVKIVNLLLDDGRMPASEIARRIGDTALTAWSMKEWCASALWRSRKPSG